MNRSELRDLVLAAGVGLLLGASLACASMAVSEARGRLTPELATYATRLGTVFVVWRPYLLLFLVLAALAGSGIVVRRRRRNPDGPAPLVWSIRAHSRAAASQPPGQRLTP